MSSRVCAAMIAQLAFGEPIRPDQRRTRNANKPKKDKTSRFHRRPRD